MKREKVAFRSLTASKRCARLVTVLSIVSTPVGNLKDITVRALETLRICDAIVCEDTRVTGNLIKVLDLPKKELISFHGHTDASKADFLTEKLKRGAHLALVSDAGTPCISDPGFALVSRAREAGVHIEVIPGASAFLAALSGSGFAVNRFSYLGFPPLKKGRQTFFADIARCEHTTVFYESVHRIKKTVAQLSEALREQPERRICIARELTKMHEEFLVFPIGRADEVCAVLTEKGEFAVVVDHMPKPDRSVDDAH